MNKVVNFIISFLKNCIMPLIKSNKLNANKKYNRQSISKNAFLKNKL